MRTRAGKEDVRVLPRRASLDRNYEGEMRTRRFRATSAVAAEDDAPGASSGEAGETPPSTSATGERGVPADAWAARQTLTNRQMERHHLTPIRDSRTKRCPPSS